MDKKLERNIIWTLAIILILVGLVGCVKPFKAMSGPVEDKVLFTDTISNIPAIAEALGCVFAPQTPACQKDMQDKPMSTLTEVEEFGE